MFVDQYRQVHFRYFMCSRPSAIQFINKLYSYTCIVHVFEFDQVRLVTRGFKQRTRNECLPQIDLGSLLEYENYLRLDQEIDVTV